MCKEQKIPLEERIKFRNFPKPVTPKIASKQNNLVDLNTKNQDLHLKNEGEIKS